MSKKHIEDCVRTSLESYLQDLRGEEPDGIYAMLIGIVPVLALMGWNAWGLSQAGAWSGGYGGLIGLGVAFVVSYATIAFLMQWLRRGSLAP